MKLNKKFFLIFGLILMLSLPFALSGCVPCLPEVIEVTGVSITEDDQSVKVGDTLQLTAAVTPEDADNKAVTWESDNTDVAAVDENGLVTAFKKGVANITVLTEDGAFTDTIVITVTKPYTPTVKRYEVNFQVVGNLAGGISGRQGNNSDLSGFKIEIFTDAQRLNKKTNTLTDATGKASVKLPNGEYWFRVSKEGYADYPPEAPLSLQRQTQPGYFKVEGADVTDIPPIPVQKTYILTMVVDPTGSGTASDNTNTGPYTAGTVVTISAEAAADYFFTGWSAPSGSFSDAASASTSFMMPADDVIVTANFATTLFAEDFTGLTSGIPDGWSTTHPDNWYVFGTNLAGGTAPEMMLFCLPVFNGISRLVSPAINTAGASGLSLSFKHHLDHLGSVYPLKVQVSIDGGTSWTDSAWSIHVSSPIPAETITVDLSAYIGQTIWIAWVLEGNSPGMNHWFIDDILLQSD
jgi:hypothetical protein